MPGPRADGTQWLVFLRQQVPLAGRESGWSWSAGMEAWVSLHGVAILWERGTVSLRHGQIA